MLGKLKNIIKKHEFLYNLWFHATSADYKRNLRDMVSSCVKKTDEMRREMKMLQAYWGCAPDQYVLYRLFEKKQSDDELKDWIPPYYFYAYWLPERQKVSNRDEFSDKIRQHELFAERKCPEPEVIAVLRKGNAYDGSGRKLSSYMDIIRKIPAAGEKIFIKPADGRGGKGIHILEAADNTGAADCFRFFKFDGKLISQYALEKKFENFTGIVQKGVHQRADMAELNPDSLNTFRFATCTEDGKRKVAVVTLRTGRKGTIVDNVDSGGLAVLINTADGSFADTAYSSSEAFRAHPDTGCVFAGRKIKDWNKICRAVLETAGKFPEFDVAGWDIALAEDGIKLLEFNLRPGLGIQITANRGLRREFGIDPEKDRIGARGGSDIQENRKN